MDVDRDRLQAKINYVRGRLEQLEDARQRGKGPS